MKRISATSTSFYKRGFPILWFGFLGLFVLFALLSDAVTERSVAFLVIPLVMGGFGYVVMRKFVWDLADEVHDAYEFLVIKNRGREHHLPFTDIMNVSASMHINPPRITLRLTGASSKGPLGAEVAFSPDRPFSLNPFAKCEVAEDLIVRVDRARSKRAV